MPQLSASTLKLFQECPRCFWLHVNKKLERPRGPFPSLPSGIDRVLKGYFDAYRRQGLLPPLIQGKVEGRLGSNALTLGFNDARTHARLWGKLDDCLVLPDDRLAPLDHKTRASAPEDLSYTITYYQFQMDVYTLLLERDGHPISRTAYVVYYCPVAGSLHQGFPFEVTVHHIATNPDAAYRVFVDGCRCLEGPLPEGSASCAFCRWVEVRARLPASPSRPSVATPRLAPSEVEGLRSGCRPPRVEGSSRAKSWFDSACGLAHHNPERAQRVEGSRDDAVEPRACPEGSTSQAIPDDLFA